MSAPSSFHPCTGCGKLTLFPGRCQACQREPQPAPPAAAAPAPPPSRAVLPEERFRRRLDERWWA
jgi:hypothetical protein